MSSIVYQRNFDEDKLTVGKREVRYNKKKLKLNTAKVLVRAVGASYFDIILDDELLNIFRAIEEQMYGDIVSVIKHDRKENEDYLRIKWSRNVSLYDRNQVEITNSKWTKYIKKDESILVLLDLSLIDNNKLNIVLDEVRISKGIRRSHVYDSDMDDDIVSEEDEEEKVVEQNVDIKALSELLNMTFVKESVLEKEKKNKAKVEKNNNDDYDSNLSNAELSDDEGVKKMLTLNDYLMGE